MVLDCDANACASSLSPHCARGDQSANRTLAGSMCEAQDQRSGSKPPMRVVQDRAIMAVDVLQNAISATGAVMSMTRATLAGTIRGSLSRRMSADAH